MSIKNNLGMVLLGVGCIAGGIGMIALIVYVVISIAKWTLEG